MLYPMVDAYNQHNRAPGIVLVELDIVVTLLLNDARVMFHALLQETDSQ